MVKFIIIRLANTSSRMQSWQRNSHRILMCGRSPINSAPLPTAMSDALMYSEWVERVGESLQFSPFDQRLRHLFFSHSAQSLARRPTDFEHEQYSSTRPLVMWR